MAKAPAIDTTVLAAQYGFAMSVLNSDPELKKLFQRAVAQTYTQERFTAELRSTKWYQNHSETWRNAQMLKAADPTTYKTNVSQVKTRLTMLAASLGAVITDAQLTQMAETAYQFGWDDNQIQQNLATYVKFTDGRMIGQAGQWEQELREHAQRQGVNVSDEWLQWRVTNIASGKQTLEDAKSGLDQYAISAFPHLAERLRAGETVQEIADPYRQTMAQLLELNPESITMKDPTLRGALAAKDDKGQPVLRTIYDFENDLRKDKRWLKTKNAQDAGMNTVRKVLNDMGVLAS
jgi:hypothetical protein